jgi:hypothetical protein
VNLTETHWQLLELAQEAPLILGEDPDAIDELVAGGFLQASELERDPSGDLTREIMRGPEATRVEIAWRGVPVFLCFTSAYPNEQFEGQVRAGLAAAQVPVKDLDACSSATIYRSPTGFVEA